MLSHKGYDADRDMKNLIRKKKKQSRGGRRGPEESEVDDAENRPDQQRSATTGAGTASEVARGDGEEYADAP